MKSLATTLTLLPSWSIIIGFSIFVFSSPCSVDASIHAGGAAPRIPLSASKEIVTTSITMDDVEEYLNSIGSTLDDVRDFQHQKKILASDLGKKRYSLGRHLSNDSDVNTADLEEEMPVEGEAVIEEYENVNYTQNVIAALVCVTVAAMAAGLTMGLLSLDLLDLRIKELAASDKDERKQAKTLVPLIKDHHRLLVTLLLMNALANEALPLFLDKLVPAYVAVILSVTLLLFFGEIIPSAVFTGPNQLAISSKLAPFVRFILFILAPVAWPIAKLLDIFLHDSESLERYDRDELSALVRLQFEHRKAAKVMRKKEKSNLVHTLNYHSDLQLQPTQSHDETLVSQRYVKHIDEVNMIDGALKMHSRKVQDVMQPWKQVYTIPYDMILTQRNIVEIYRSGHSRIPVFERQNDDDEDVNKCIVGLFKTRQLAVINSQDQRNLSTLPLATPLIVKPGMNMVDLLNLLQDGKGHMAIVCLNPEAAIEALDKKIAIPLSAEVIGIVTLEDCIEELIQEEIYDEYDKEEKIAFGRAKKAIEKWRGFVKRKKESRQASNDDINNDITDENTNLLPIV